MSITSTTPSTILTINLEVEDITNDYKKCIHYPLNLLDFKMVFVGCIGTVVALISFFNNLILFYAFLSTRQVWTPHRNLTYLTGLSVCDIIVSFLYIAIMSIQVYAEYFLSEPLFIAWHFYLPFAFTLSNITFTTAGFLLVAATLERYLQINALAKSPVYFMTENHNYGLLLAIILALIFKGTIFFEIEIYHLAHCVGLSSSGVKLSKLALNSTYDSVWRFWTRRIVTIFLPFFVLAYCNLCIVYNLKQSEKKSFHKKIFSSFFSKKSKQFRFVYTKRLQHFGFNNSVTQVSQSNSQENCEKKLYRKTSPRVRSATQMLIIVVTCYLIANALDVILAIWEYYDANSLAQLENIYTIATDISSLLSVSSSSLRMPIYLLAGDKILKSEIKRTLSSLYLRICRKKQNLKTFYRSHNNLILPNQPILIFSPKNINLKRDLILPKNN